jgi:DNA-binding transcriptional MerR regulator
MTIAEVSKKFNLSADTLRYYERLGLIPSVRRTSGGIRDYSEKDCNWVEFIRRMRDAGVSVDPLIEYVALFQQGDNTREARKMILVEQRDNLVNRATELQKLITRLDYKIEHYFDTIAQAEQSLNNGERLEPCECNYEG